MGLQFAAARGISAASTWGLKHVFHRPAANFPGKVALYVDPDVIAHLATRLREGSVAVVGTNGKTTTTNLLADVIEASGKTVVCNRTGANLDSGVATSLLQSKGADWGVFETDELWLARILPRLQATYVLLLNLFRDQLDRCGEIDRIQESIIGALKSSPNTTLVYNADDPLCAYIADQVDNASVAFGVSEDMGLPQNSVADAQMCQRCSSMFEYAFRQYGQLGAYRCPQCGFERPALDYAVSEASVAASGVSFTLQVPLTAQGEKARDLPVRASLGGAYMVYNLAAVATASDLLGCPQAALQRAIDAFDPQNGRLQTFDLDGRRVLLNLAKNPTGFNQNLKIIAQDRGRKAVAFFVNDKEGDGRDVSWLWDIDFEELCASGELAVFAGGLRGRDMQVRLKYAGIEADVVEDLADVLARIDALPQDVNAYLIANYTALPGVHAALDKRVASGRSSAAGVSAPELRDPSATNRVAGAPFASGDAGSPLVIAYVFPDLLNLYGDGGNVRILEQRLRWRGIPVEIKRVAYGQTVDFANTDLMFLGGGPDREQRLASVELMRMRDGLKAYVEDDGVLLAICGGYQALGHEWLLGGEVVKGIGIVDMTTERPGTSADRLIGNIVLRSACADAPVIGYENHAGRTHLGPGVQPFGEVASSAGHGNNDDDRVDGILYKNVVGTYLHGPLLAKNPQVADELLKRALERHARRLGGGAPCAKLAPLDDEVELAANRALCERLGVK